jgi:hypothetical protein
MDFPFTLPGCEHIPLTLRTGLFSGAKILYQGIPLKKIPGRKFVLGLSDGSDLTLGLKPNALDLLVPQVVYNNDVIPVAPKLPVYQQVLVYLPFLLMFIGGGIGGLCGGVGAIVNLHIFHSSQHSAVKVLLSILTTVGAGVLWLIAAVALNLAIRH